MDVICTTTTTATTTKKMNAKRKAESHSRPVNRPRFMKSGGSRTDSERDSGFSDASTMDTTDSEDSPRPVVQQGPTNAGSGPQPSQLAVVGGSYSGVSPMIIMNNVLLKQPGDNPPALKPWGFSPTVEVVQPVVQQPQVVFLQPVVSRQASSASKEGASRHKRPKKYLPILKSYPKIAPHPGDGSSSSSGRGTASISSSSSSSPSSSCSSSSSYSSSSGSKRGSAAPSKHREHHHRDKHPQSVLVSGSVSSPSSTTSGLPGTCTTTSPLLQRQLSVPTPESNTSSSSSSPARERLSQAELTGSISITHTSDSKKELLPFAAMGTEQSVSQEDSDSDSKRKRFCNTYNILSKSGLLDITLRTKELLRQNRHTQNDLDRLREQTDLFLLALQSGDSSICLKLQARLQEEDRDRERAARGSLTAD